jgi:hypothetical protein
MSSTSTTPPSWKDVLGENHHVLPASELNVMVYFHPMKNFDPPSHTERLENELKSMPSDISQ